MVAATTTGGGATARPVDEAGIARPALLDDFMERCLQAYAAVLEEPAAARSAGRRTALVVACRPSLRAVAGPGEGESRFVESAAMAAGLAKGLRTSWSIACAKPRASIPTDVS